MIITALVLFSCSIFVTIRFRRYLPTQEKKKMIVVHEEGDTSDEEEGEAVGVRTMSLSMNPNFDYNINDSDESDESDDMAGFGEIKIHPAEDEPETEAVKPTPRATFLGQKVVKDLIRRRSRLELERAQEAAEKKLQNQN